MKNFKKLVLAFLVLVVAAFSFTGCSKTSTQVEMEAMEGIREPMTWLPAGKHSRMPMAR